MEIRKEQNARLMNQMWGNNQYNTVTTVCSLLDTLGGQNQKNPTDKIVQRINKTNITSRFENLGIPLSPNS